MLIRFWSNCKKLVLAAFNSEGEGKVILQFLAHNAGITEVKRRPNRVSDPFHFHFILYSLSTVTPSAKAALSGAVTEICNLKFTSKNLRTKIRNLDTKLK